MNNKAIYFIGGFIWALVSSRKAYAPNVNTDTLSPYMPTIKLEYTQEACERTYNTYNKVIPEVIAKYGSKEDYIEHCKRFGNL